MSTYVPQRHSRFGVTRLPVGALAGLILGLVVWGPATWGNLTGKFVLRYDMVFVPHLALSEATLGLTASVPRAIPNDSVVALLSTVLPGSLVQLLIILGAFVAIGAAVDRWSAPTSVRVIAAIGLCWNPWVAERLSIGHWGYLWGYAALAWVIVGALEFRRAADARSGRTLIIGVIMGALSGSTGAVLVALSAVCLLAWPGRGRMPTRRLLIGAIWWAGLNAAWWFPYLVLAPSGSGDANGVTAFAARAETPGGVLTSVLGGGGIWHSPSWFSERNSILGVVAGGVAVAGVAVITRRYRRTAGLAPLALACTSLLVAVAGSLPGLRTCLVWVVQNVPGGGLLRDGQKFAAPLVILAALGVALGAHAVALRTRGTLLAPVAIIAAAIIPVVLLPGLAWGRGGDFAAHRYPSQMLDAQKVVHDDLTDDAGVAIFPWRLYRDYAWNGHVTVMDPWDRLLADKRVLRSDDLALRDSVVKGESPVAAEIDRAVASKNRQQLENVLRKNGYRYVLIERDQPSDGSPVATLGRPVLTNDLVQVRHLGTVEQGRTSDDVTALAPLGLVSTVVAIAAPAALGLRRRAQRTAAAQP